MNEALVLEMTDVLIGEMTATQVARAVGESYGITYGRLLRLEKEGLVKSRLVRTPDPCWPDEPGRYERRLWSRADHDDMPDNPALLRLEFIRADMAKLLSDAGEVAEELRGQGLGVCRVCFCTDVTACDPPCSWVEPDLCSGCAE